MKDDLKQDVNKDPAELEREADRARANVEHTLEALERRFSPGQLLDQVIQVVRENGGDFGRNLSTQVRNNPVPVVLTGIGLTWLMAASDRPPQRSYGSYAASGGSTAASHASSAAEATRGAAGRAAETTRSAAEGARSAMSHAAESARGALGSAREGTRSAMDHMSGTAHRVGYATRSSTESLVRGYDYLRREQPLVLGALAVATGALIGAMFPRTSTEDEWMGETSDEAAHRLKEEARHKAEEAKSAAADAAESARRAAEPRRTEASTSGAAASPGTPGSTTGTPGSATTGSGSGTAGPGRTGSGSAGGISGSD